MFYFLSRFYVVANDEERDDITIDNFPDDDRKWLNCIPKIVCNAHGVGCIEVTWSRLSAQNAHLISHFQLFLNDVSYRKKIPSNVTKVIVKGLAGGRNYDTILMVYPKDKTFLPQQSNLVTVKSGRTTNLGGPIISLKENARPDQITVTWQSIDSSKCPIECYELLINEEKRDVVSFLKPFFFWGIKLIFE
jgi:hypothetical protein